MPVIWFVLIKWLASNWHICNVTALLYPKRQANVLFTRVLKVSGRCLEVRTMDAVAFSIILLSKGHGN